MKTRVFLVRHGMSRANVDWKENIRVADHAISLTEEGKKQARLAGAAFSQYLQENLIKYETEGVFGPSRFIIPKIRGWRSPYLRTRQTCEEFKRTCVLSSLADVHKDHGKSEFNWARRDGEKLEHLHPGDSWFLDDKEHRLLHEQKFGLFDGLSDSEREEQFPKEYAYYMKCKASGGKVWAPLPMGESRIDVAQRIHQSFGTFHRDADRHGIHNIVVFGHGTTNRCFTMEWLGLNWEWLETEPNPKNCSIRLLEDGEDKGYIFKGFENPEGYKHNGPNHETEE